LALRGSSSALLVLMLAIMPTSIMGGAQRTDLCSALQGIRPGKLRHIKHVAMVLVLFEGRQILTDTAPGPGQVTPNCVAWVSGRVPDQIRQQARAAAADRNMPVVRFRVLVTGQLQRAVRFQAPGHPFHAGNGFGVSGANEYQIDVESWGAISAPF